VSFVPLFRSDRPLQRIPSLTLDPAPLCILPLPSSSPPFSHPCAQAPVNFVEAEWLQAERFVARRPSPSNPGWEVLVKWRGQVGGSFHWVGGWLALWVGGHP
jgi:hypothetical protein